LVPASLYGLKRDADALSAVTDACNHMRPASPDNDGRASVLALMFVSLASLSQKGHFESTDEQRSAMIQGWLSACQVPEHQLQRVIQSMQEQ
jgi:hypothetical protein